MHKLPSFPLVIGIGRAPGHAGAAPLVLDRGLSRLPPAVANTPARIIGGGPDRGNARTAVLALRRRWPGDWAGRARGPYHREVHGASAMRPPCPRRLFAERPWRGVIAPPVTARRSAPAYSCASARKACWRNAANRTCSSSPE
ncbi:hypothetical protein [Xanthomonas sp. WHRI 7945]|nr:hypothetical protein [Xanthomonas campestris pv. campestris]